MPDGVFNVVHGDKVAVDALLEHPDVAAVSLRRLDADRALHLRDRHEARQARAGARRREEPHDRAAGRGHRDGRRRRGVAPPTAPPASAAWPISQVVAVGARRRRPRRRRSRQRLPKIKVGDGLDPASEMGPLVTREHRDKVAGYIEGARDRARRSSPTAARRRPRATASSSASRCSTTSRPRWTPTATRSSARCSGSRASRPTTRRCGS